jgi:hypothetical protein
MRARVFVGFSFCFAAAALGPWACIPHPEQDFEDYQERIANIPKTQIEASTFDGAPPAEAVKGLYYGACATELAKNQLSKVFNLYTNTEFTPAAGGGQLVLSFQLLKVKNGTLPPDTVTSADIVGGIIQGAAAPVDATGKFSLSLGTATFPGDANPISGSDVRIENTTLIGRFSAGRICARLGGQVVQPVAAARTLDDTNICQFFPVNEGDPRPEPTLADFQKDACGL